MVDVRTVIDETPVRSLIDTATDGVVVLERIARGGGETRWFFIESTPELDVLIERLAPGSVVTFYFDGRIARIHADARLTEELLSTIEDTGDVMVGLLGPDSCTIEMESIGGPLGLAEFMETLGTASTIFAGPFPARDNDGENAVTVAVPDADGVIRDHPH